MPIEDFKMFDEWNQQGEQRAAIPVNTAPAIVAASWWKRVGAALIDGLILGIPIGLFAFSGVLAQMQGTEFVDPVSGEANPDAMQEMTALMAGVQWKISLAYLIVGGAYVILMHGLKGKTLGKMALGIRVVNEDGSPIDVPIAAKRAVVSPIAGIVPVVGGLLGLLNGLWPLWDEKKQSLGDKFAGTLVVEWRD